MIIEVYRDSAVIASIETDKAEHIQKIMGDDYVNISFEDETYISFLIGDYITVDGTDYFLNTLPKIDKKASNDYSYVMSFESVMYEMAKVQYMLTGSGEFDLVGDAHVFADLLVTNMNRIQSGWSHGTIDTTDYRNIHFSCENCLEVMQRLAQEFDIEFYLVGKQINFTDFGVDNGLTFQYGFNKGLYSISRNAVDSKNLITRLYAFGSTKNLPVNYRTYSPRLKFVTGGVSYVEDYTYTADIIEFSKNFDEVYPKIPCVAGQAGVITAVNAGDVLKFTDVNMFDLNAQRLSGVTPKVHFQDGSLGGYEFEVGPFDNSTKEFTLVLFDDGKAGKLPSSTIKPAVGNTYVLVDIIMPQTYIDTAETELLTKAQAYLTQNCSPRVDYSVDVDPLFIKRNSYTLSIGDYITIIDSDLGINKLIRITELTHDLVIPQKYKLTLADTIAISTLTRMYADNLETQRVLTNPKIALKDNYRIRKNWQTVSELRAMTFDPEDDYFDMENIRPLSIETNMLSVGSKSANFELNGVVIEPNYGGVKSTVVVGSGTLVHYAIATTITTWNITGATTTGLVDGTAYYIYAKCTRASAVATIVFDSTQRLADSDATYYYFVIGVLHSVVDSVRRISLTHGFTTINGKFITTGRISSAGGGTYFDLDSGVISGQITFVAGSSGYANITDAVRTFNTTPTTPYNIGDVWNAGSTGDVKRCIVQRLTGAYVAADWELASKYTDDTIATIANKSSGYIFNDDFVESQTVFDSRWTNYFGSGSPTITSASDASGGFILRIGNNSGDDASWLIGSISIPFDPTKIYKIKCRIRQNYGAGVCYIGVAGRNYDDTLWVNSIGANLADGFYMAAANKNPGSTFVDYIGYFKGNGTNLIANATDPFSPSNLHTNVRYFRPLIGVNYPNATGQYDIDYFTIEAADADTKDRTQTVIDGGLVTTGRLEVGSGDLGEANAGISGNDDSDDAIRFWAGDTFANRATAPFQVHDNGVIICSTTFILNSITTGTRLYSDATILSVQKNIENTYENIITFESVLVAENRYYGVINLYDVNNGVSFMAVQLSPGNIWLRSATHDTFIGSELSIFPRARCELFSTKIVTGTLPTLPGDYFDEGTFVFQNYQGYHIRAYINGAWRTFTGA